MPFSRSRRSPRTLHPGVHHAQKPSSVTVVRFQSPVVRDNIRPIPNARAQERSRTGSS